jgi:hypothetical protein
VAMVPTILTLTVEEIFRTLYTTHNTISSSSSSSSLSSLSSSSSSSSSTASISLSASSSSKYFDGLLFGHGGLQQFVLDLKFFAAASAGFVPRCLYLPSIFFNLFFSPMFCFSFLFSSLISFFLSSFSYMSSNSEQLVRDLIDRAVSAYCTITQQKQPKSFSEHLSPNTWFNQMIEVCISLLCLLCLICSLLFLLFAGGWFFFFFQNSTFFFSSLR